MGCGCKARREKLARLNTRVGRWLAKKLGKPVDQESLGEGTRPSEAQGQALAAEGRADQESGQVPVLPLRQGDD